MLKLVDNSLFLGKLLALLFAACVTTCLVFVMHLLISMAQPSLGESKTFVMPKFVHVPEPENVNTIKPPVKPPEVPDRPDTPKQEIKPQVKVNNFDVKLATSVSINKSNKIGLAPGDGEYLPIVKIAPIYPKRAAQRCLSGYVIVGFTVTTSGSVRDPYVVESSSKLFESSAKKAAVKFKYKPRMVDGAPVEVPNVKNKISYNMESC
jgi:protein TonB